MIELTPAELLVLTPADATEFYEGEGLDDN